MSAPVKYIVKDKSGRSAKPYEVSHEHITSIGEGEEWEPEFLEWLQDCEAGDEFTENNIIILAL